MPPVTPRNISHLARFLRNRIEQIRPYRSLSEVANLAGFRSPKMLTMVLDGRSTLPLDRVVGLSNAIEVDLVMLASLTLEQFFNGPQVNDILSSRQHQPLVDPTQLNATAIAMGVEMTVALHNVRNHHELLSGARKQIENLEETLMRVMTAIDALVAETNALV